MPFPFFVNIIGLTYSFSSSETKLFPAVRQVRQHWGTGAVLPSTLRLFRVAVRHAMLQPTRRGGRSRPSAHRRPGGHPGAVLIDKAIQIANEEKNRKKTNSNRDVFCTQGVVRKTVSDELAENIWRHMDKIVPPLLYNMQTYVPYRLFDGQKGSFQSK